MWSMSTAARSGPLKARCLLTPTAGLGVVEPAGPSVALGSGCGGRRRGDLGRLSGGYPAAAAPARPVAYLAQLRPGPSPPGAHPAQSGAATADRRAAGGPPGGPSAT